MRHVLIAVPLLLSLAAQAQEPVAGLPCEGCEWVFSGLPNALAARARIAPFSELGEPMVVSGKVSGADGKARAGVIVYAYQTNAAGIYPTTGLPADAPARRHGTLRGWTRTDANGGYAFDTIRPAGYPKTNLPAHIHMHVIEPGCATYYIDDIVFTDDPRLTPNAIARMAQPRGGSGVTTPQRKDAGPWLVKRDIQLGSNIPGYPACGKI
jgi:protocatechuate 3,4-dioxygenase beta subunit